MFTWRVNSYGYPNPFGGAKAVRAWEMFMSFTEHRSYRDVKSFWEAHPRRPVSAHGVESWKASFEEFGILYVLAGDDRVHITPGGSQLLDMASAFDKHGFAWVGMNLLLRYPLRGKAGRGSYGPPFETSDLLLYWFLLAAFLELRGRLWHSEIFRVLAKAFRRTEAVAAVDLIRRCRAGTAEILDQEDPSGGKTGAVYNNLNQVMVHGSLNHMIFSSSREVSPHLDGQTENLWYLRDEYVEEIELTLVGSAAILPPSCGSRPDFVSRMPAAPVYSDDEQGFFEYLGAAVPTLAEARAQHQALSVPIVEYDDDTVFLLSEGRHFDRLGGTEIDGPRQALCVLAPDQRVILSDDLSRTFIIVAKELRAPDRVRVRLRPARPILNQGFVLGLFEEVGNGHHGQG